MNFLLNLSQLKSQVWIMKFLTDLVDFKFGPAETLASGLFI